jgi:lipid-A-disaccharide synthase-like uncharacterized protein
VLQWLASERQKKSIIPIAFWYFSIAGGVTLLVYAVYRRDPVFITGQPQQRGVTVERSGQTRLLANYLESR